MNLSAPRDPQGSSEVHKSLGLKALLDRVRDDQIYSILDLGPALEANVQFWSQFTCRLHIHDFYRSYRERKPAPVPEEESDAAMFSSLLSFNDQTVFDIILAWDLFNYLELKELEALVQRLSRWCRPGTMLFTLISSLPKIAMLPMMFRILNGEQLMYKIPTRATRPSPRHQPRDIIKLMSGFTVSNSFLSRHGIQEYVFVFK
jgi:hypothetical protein